MKLIWSDYARFQMRTIRDSVSLQSPGYPMKTARRIARRVSILKTVPYAGPEVPEYDDPMIRELFESPYRILYRIGIDRVEITGIFDAASHLPRTPPG